MKPYLNTSITNTRIREDIIAGNYFTSVFVLGLIAVMLAVLIIGLLATFIAIKLEQRKNKKSGKHTNKHINIVSVFKK